MHPCTCIATMSGEFRISVSRNVTKCSDFSANQIVYCVGLDSGLPQRSISLISAKIGALCHILGQLRWMTDGKLNNSPTSLCEAGGQKMNTQKKKMS